MAVEERLCPINYETRLFKRPPCGGKIVKKEPLLSHDKIIGQIPGPKKIEEARALDEIVPDFIYQCENGHSFTRPDWWADVPVVAPGTISTMGYSGSKEIANKPPLWYSELSDEEKEKVYKK